MDGTGIPPQLSRVVGRLTAMGAAIGVVLLLAAGPAAAAPSFTDVGTSHWAYEAVEWSYARGIATGYTGSGGLEFRPQEGSTRAQMINFLWKAAGSPTGLPAHSMTNVPPWVEDAVRWGVYEGIVGPTGNFNPTNPAVRSIVVTWLWKYVDQPTGYPSTSFSDVPGGANYKQAVDWAVASGVASGFSDGTFRPGDALSRAQTVVWLYATFLPPTPSGLAVSNGGRTDVLTATWSAPTGYTRFRVAVDGGTPLEVTGTSHQFTGLLPQTSHTVTVRTLGGGQAIGSTASASGATADRPAAPTNVQVTDITSTSATITWNSNGDANRNGWAVKPGPNGHPPEWVSGWSWIEDENATSFVATGLNPNVPYQFAVEAIGYQDRWPTGSDNYHSDDVVVSATTAPRAPDGLAVSSSRTDRLDVTWEPVPGFSSYRLALDGGSPVTVTGGAHAFTGLLPGTSHVVTVRTVGAGTLLSGTASANGTTTSELVAPANVRVTDITSTSFTLTWEADGDANRNGWAAKRSTGSATPAWVSGWSWVEDETATSRTWSGLAPGTSYHIAFEAIGYDTRWPGGANDAHSDDVEFDVATAAGASPAPTNVSLGNALTDRLTASWTPQPGYSTYKVSLDGGAALSVTGSSYTFTGLAPGSSHTVGVRTAGVAGQPDSTVATANGTTTSRLTQPTGLSTTATTNSITVSWTKDADAHRNGWGILLNGGWHQWIENENATSATVTGLSPGTSYTIGVQSIGYDNGSVSWPGPYYSPTASVTRTTAGAAPCQSTEAFQTASVGGTWSIVNASGTPVQWNSVNIRVDNFGSSRGWDAADIQAIADRGFNSIRAALEWVRFQPNQEGVFSSSALATLDYLMDAAEDAGLAVILDPVHTTRQADNWRIPSWAWSNAGLTPSQNNVVPVVDRKGIPYVIDLLERYCDHPALAAIDVVNEPDNPEDSLSLNGRYVNLVNTYRDWIDRLREVDPDKPLMFEPFNGSTVIQAQRLIDLGAGNNDIIWSFHDYFTGQGSTTGYRSSGWPDGQRTESWASSDCYLNPDVSLANCNPSWAQRTAARLATEKHVEVHYTAAQAGHMPLYVGEYNIPHSASGHAGWGGGWKFLCDKSAVYRALGVSRAIWDWQAPYSLTYGMYNPSTNQWNDWTSALFAGTSECASHTLTP